MIEKHLLEELPFMATENIMMEAVKRGGDRQELHEGGKNDLLDRIAADSAFGVTREELEGIMKPENFVGRAPQQTQEFVDNEIQPILDKYSDLLGLDVEIKV